MYGWLCVSAYQWNRSVVGTIEKRIEDLEVRYTHQQVWIDELNEVVREQSELIEKLRNELIRLRENVSERISQEKPPHY